MGRAGSAGGAERPGQHRRGGRGRSHGLRAHRGDADRRGPNLGGLEREPLGGRGRRRDVPAGRERRGRGVGRGRGACVAQLPSGGAGGDGRRAAGRDHPLRACARGRAARARRRARARRS